MPDSPAAALKVKLRTAKTADAVELAEVYLSSASKLAEHFLPKLGRSFLERYHRILLAEPHSLVLCLEDHTGKIIALASGTSDTEEHLVALSRSRVLLVWSAIGAILRGPSILGAMYERFLAARQGKEEKGFTLGKGPRLEYWGCIEGAVSPLDAMDLLLTWLAVFRRLGQLTVSCEVDSSNQKVLRIHKAFGAKVERKFTTGDGRERFILRYDLNDDITRRLIGC